MKKTSLAVASVVAFYLIPSSSGAVIYSEALQGDLSGSFANPQMIHLNLGANTLIAQMGNNGNKGATNGSDADYFTVTLDPGLSLLSITLDSYTFSPNNPGVSFVGYVAAAAFAGQGGGDIDGSAFIDASSGNILDDFTGGPAPLGQGVYSFWFQETSANRVDYQLTFNVIPEPSAAFMCFYSFSFLLTRHRRSS